MEGVYNIVALLDDADNLYCDDFLRYTHSYTVLIQHSFFLELVHERSSAGASPGGIIVHR